MPRRGTGAPLRVLLLSYAAPAAYRAAAEALEDLGLDLLVTGRGDEAEANQRRDRLRPADLVVLLLADAAPAPDRAASAALARPQKRVFVCLPPGTGEDDLATLGLNAGLSDHSQALHTVRYEGAADLGWKLAQAISGLLSDMFREAQRRQLALLSGDQVTRRRTLVALATHRDARLRQLAARLALHQASGRLDEAEDLIRLLVGANKASGFGIAARLLQAMALDDAGEAARLLHELICASTSFRGWALARLAL